MTPEERDSLIIQVVKVIQRESGNESYNYYGDFFQECNNLQISETDFRKTILRMAFERFGGIIEEDPEEHIPNLNKFVDLFDKRCYNLRQLGRVLFENPFESEEYLEDVVAIKHDVTLLSSSSSAGLEIARLYKSEADPTNRYLRIIYNLNPTLEIRLDGELFKNTSELLNKGEVNPRFHHHLAHDFMNERLQIWLIETAQESATLLPEGNTYHDFLEFVYRLKSSYPLYLNERPIYNPSELVTACKKEKDLWPVLFEHISNGQVEIWFKALGKKDWIEAIHTYFLRVQKIEYLSAEDKIMTGIQFLLHNIQPDYLPHLEPKTKTVRLVSITEKDAFERIIPVNLASDGFVKANLFMDHSLDGVSLVKKNLNFFNLRGQITDPIIFTVDPLKLTRNKVYHFTIFVETIFETLEIKVDLKVIFPVKDFIIENLKYAFLLAAIFGLTRTLLSVQFPEWLNTYHDYYLSWEEAEFLLPKFNMYEGTFFLFFVTFLFSVFITIKKNRQDVKKFYQE